MDIYFFKDFFPPSSHLWQLEELEELFVIDSAPLGLLIREKYEREAGRQQRFVFFWPLIQLVKCIRSAGVV